MAGMNKTRFSKITQAAVALQEAETRKLWEAEEFDFTIHGTHFKRDAGSEYFSVDNCNWEVESSTEMLVLIKHIICTAGSNRFTVES